MGPNLIKNKKIKSKIINENLSAKFCVIAISYKMK